jgi:hypothetical protein
LIKLYKSKIVVDCYYLVNVISYGSAQSDFTLSGVNCNRQNKNAQKSSVLRQSLDTFILDTFADRMKIVCCKSNMFSWKNDPEKKNNEKASVYILCLSV